jgi:hypothetical protein
MSANTSRCQMRLSETVAWCTLQRLENDPAETDEFRNRQQLAREAAFLFRRAVLLEKKNSIQSWLLHHLRLGPNEDPKELRRRGLELSRAGDVAAVLPLNGQLRTPELAPRSLFEAEIDRGEIVEELSDKRAGLLRNRGAYPTRISSDLCGGKLLIYEPDDNVADGASQHQSKGHFDAEDAPPWDTWVFYFDRHLVSWVPPKLVDLVQRGLDVNPVDSIRWADEGVLTKLLTGS